MQHAYGGGSVGEGHRYEDVSKTVTQQPRPQLERQISAGQRARREASSPTNQVAAGGLAATGLGAGVSSGASRRLKRLDVRVERTHASAAEAADRVKEANANAHVAFGHHAAAARAHADVKSRQAALAAWEKAGGVGMHRDRIKYATGRTAPFTVKAKGSSSHVTYGNRLTAEAHETAAQVKAHAATVRAEQARAEQAGREHAKFTLAHHKGLALREFATPKLKARRGAGRALMLGGGLAAAGAVVQGERKRQVGKSASQLARRVAPLRRSPEAVRAALSGPRSTELAARISRARAAAPARDPEAVRAALSAPRNTLKTIRVKRAVADRRFSMGL